MLLVYNIGMLLFGVVMRIVSFFNPKAHRWVIGRKGQLKKIQEQVEGVEPIVWVHCASLGEFEQGRPLIDEIKLKYPQKKILLTFFSPSGYDVQKDYKNADYVYYLPLDTFRNANRFINAVNPEIVFFIKYEYWYNVLRILNRKKIPVYFVSAIFRSDQLFFKWYGKWYRKLLRMATHFFVQTELSASLLDSIQISNYTITGDTRFDRVAHVAENVKALPLVESFVENCSVIVAGSTWKAEDALLKQYIRVNPAVNIILVPHEVENGNVDRIMQQFGDLAIRYSLADEQNVLGKRVLVVDCYGILTSLYQYGKIAVIGGGFGVGIHNVLEAATFGVPIIFGPNYEKFNEAVDLVNQNSAFVVNNIEEFNAVLNYLLEHDDVAQKIGILTEAYVKNNVGATKQIIDSVF